MFPELEARSEIDALLTAAGWVVQDYKKLNLAAGHGIAVREFPLKKGHGAADYLLYVGKKAVGLIEAKKLGETLTGVEVQTEKYSAGLPDKLPATIRPLPFLYQSTGVETRFTDARDPDPPSRSVFTFHRPDTLAEMLKPQSIDEAEAVPELNLIAAETPKGYPALTPLRRIQNLPALNPIGMRACQIKAVINLEQSLKNGRRRSLLQMQTGSGKTFTAVAESYRLIKYAGAKRVLFLVDRSNLGKQALAEFWHYTAPDATRKFGEEFNIQFLTSNRIDPVAKVVITTIQRLYSILQGEQEYSEELEETPLTGLAALHKDPLPVVYNAGLPIETFDVVFTDECHRSIYNLWRLCI